MSLLDDFIEEIEEEAEELEDVIDTVQGAGGTGTGGTGGAGGAGTGGASSGLDDAKKTRVTTGLDLIEDRIRRYGRERPASGLDASVPAGPAQHDLVWYASHTRTNAHAAALAASLATKDDRLRDIRDHLGGYRSAVNVPATGTVPTLD